jgi:broad specificity phosphatase PhoE
MTELILARHGETDWNVQEVFRGRADVDLNTTGKKQAELLAQYLKASKPEAIYSSPLERALRTAQIVAGQHFRVKVEPVMDLIDLDYGEWQGVSKEDVKEKYPELYERWLREPHRVKMPSGESLNNVKKRTQKVIDEIVAEHEGTILVISHRVVLKVIILSLLGLNNSQFWNVRVDSGGVTTFLYENEHYILVRHNDTCFLKTTQTAPLKDF